MEMSVMTSYPFPLARQIRGLSGTANEDLSTWRTIYEPALGNDLPEFLKRKHAVIDYLSGATDAALRQRHGLSLKAIYRLIVRRCLTVHRDGLIYGWRGLVRYSHLAPYTRSKPVIVDSAGKGAAGAMSALFALEPELQKQFDKRILTPASDDKLEEKRNRTSHWKWLFEVPPVISASGNLVKSVFEKENGLEEAVFRRADHWFFAAGGSRCANQGTVPAARL